MRRGLGPGPPSRRGRADPLTSRRIPAYPGVAAIEIAHGDGLSGSSITYGVGAHTDWEWIEVLCDAVTRAVPTTLLLPGIGTVHDLRRGFDWLRLACAAHADALGIRSVRVATHCTEADISAQHIAATRDLGMDVAGRGWLPDDVPHGRAHRTGPAARLMESYGANCGYVTDSGGHLDMEGVRDRVSAYRDVLDPSTELGIHAHHNLGLGVANSVVAVENGVTRVDASLAGQGAGAGNCPLEAFVAVAELMGWEPGLRPVPPDGRRRRRRTPPPGPRGAGGPRNPHPGLRGRVLRLPAPCRDGRQLLRHRRPRDPHRGRRGLVGGQEDMITDIDLDLAAVRTTTTV